MQLPALCCGAALLLAVPWAAAERDAERPLLQDLLETLGQLWEEEEEEGALEDGAEAGGSERDVPGPGTPQPAEGQSRWRSDLASHGRRHFSGCFGTRMERIGAQTGLGCNHYKARFWRRGRS